MEQAPKERKDPDVLSIESEMTLPEFADALEELQAKENQGRGITCVRDIILYLRRGDIASARRIAEWDHDKITNYPEVKDFLSEELFRGMKHPWQSIFDRE